MAIRDALLSRDLDALIARFYDRVAIKVPTHPLTTDKTTGVTRFREAFFDTVDRVGTLHGTLIIDGRKDSVRAQAKLKIRDDAIVAYYQESPLNPHRLSIDLAFNGAMYEGFQRQPGKRTIQGELEAALKGLFKRPLDVHPASRTDAGVHAHHHVVHLDVDTPLESKEIGRLLNRMLPGDIRVLDVHRVPGVFHARYDATGKTYRYRLMHVDDPFRAHLTMRTDAVDADRLGAIMDAYVGTHDFKNLAKSTDKDTVRTIHEVRVRPQGDETLIDIRGEGFLRHMVRMMVARALDDLRKGTDTVNAALKHPDKPMPKPLVPAAGLHLIAVHYDTKGQR